MSWCSDSLESLSLYSCTRSRCDLAAALPRRSASRFARCSSCFRCASVLHAPALTKSTRFPARRTLAHHAPPVQVFHAGMQEDDSALCRAFHRRLLRLCRLAGASTGGIEGCSRVLLLLALLLLHASLQVERATDEGHQRFWPTASIRWYVVRRATVTTARIVCKQQHSFEGQQVSGTRMGTACEQPVATLRLAQSHQRCASGGVPRR